ncbi:hypothetical protein LAZ67_3003930 [Cordylochernes scorpioides]|uniref:Mos1 transposase HTH domain-containing protein n=1 Tax=Cordylochernes scorpioides TaxID=51811 RepID=A0ABY6K8X7_9ARAC|nr:hypothetical protein LAZ67_3003930 [Cordylochernes scorpioides]
MALGHLLILLQYDWPREEQLFLQMLENLRTQGHFTYNLFFTYIINPDIIEELMYLTTSSGGGVALDLLPSSSTQISKFESQETSSAVFARANYCSKAKIGRVFLHRIVTGDEKWIHYDNPKRRKSWGKPGHASTSTAKPNIHGKKLMLCIWWDQLGVIYYELLQPNETITGERYQQQLMRLSRALKIKRPLYAKRHDKVIYQHDNARPHVAKVVKETLEALQWDVLPHPLYSPDIAPSDYHMFRSMTHGLAEQHFTSYEEAKNWVNVWIASKNEEFFRHGILHVVQTDHDNHEKVPNAGIKPRVVVVENQRFQARTPFYRMNYTRSLSGSRSRWSFPLSSPAKCELRSVIRFLNAKNNSPVEIHRQLVEVYGEKCMDIKNVRKWCWEFNEGRINVHDEQRSGRPSLPESTVARIDEMVRANWRITLEEIEDGLNEVCSHFSVHKIVSETLGYKKVSARWVDKWLKEAAGEWYNTGILKLVDRMKKVIEHQGDYVEK